LIIDTGGILTGRISIAVFSSGSVMVTCYGARPVMANGGEIRCKWMIQWRVPERRRRRRREETQGNFRPTVPLSKREITADPFRCPPVLRTTPR